jgi:hypothetical protein
MAFDPKQKETCLPPADDKKQEKKPAEQISVNPNPRANENIKDKKINPENDRGVGSEINDGEAG